MQKRLSGSPLLIAAVSLLAIALCPSCVTARPSHDDPAKGCLEATLSAIRMEMVRYEGWIGQRKQGLVAADGLGALEAGLASLEADLAQYSAMEPGAYVLPAVGTAVVWFEDKEPGPDSIMYFDGLSRSGPWLHLAGLSGGDFGSLKKGTRYKAGFYRVYSRDYFGMDSAYVYLAEFEALGD